MQGRDGIFFASNGIDVQSLDYSSVGIDLIHEKAKDKKLAINAKLFDVKKQLPFADATFDTVYSHMLLDMSFSMVELHFIFSEIKQILKPRGLISFLLEKKMTISIKRELR